MRTVARFEQTAVRFVVTGARYDKVRANYVQTFVNFGRTAGRELHVRNCARIELKSDQTGVRFEVTIANFVVIDVT